jgi:hypothetical protein
MSGYFRLWEITSICADFLVVDAVLANRSAAGGAESPRVSRHALFGGITDKVRVFGPWKRL